jgi:hypothetical protein
MSESGARRADDPGMIHHLSAKSPLAIPSEIRETK